MIERLRKNGRCTDQLLGLALRLASIRSERDRPMAVHRRRVDAARRSGPRERASTPTLQALLRMVEEKQRLVRLLNEYIDGPGLTVVIGTEHSDPELRPFSLIASTYFDGRSTGMVGVIGPTRMRYSSAIDVVEIAANAVGRVLRDVTNLFHFRRLTT